MIASAALAALLLVGGDTAGDERLYAACIPIADWLDAEDVDELRREGLMT
jgi:hypothetical protein